MSHLRLCLACLLLSGQLAAFADTNTNVHTTWLWHLHQPIYWPDRRDYGVDHYEQAWDTIQQQNAGRPHPTPEVLSTIFGEADRVNVYQGEIESVLSGLLSYPNAGAQVNYSGALMENVQSLAANGWNGGNGAYTLGWSNSFRIARSWTTSGGKPRLDLVNFTYHHAIAPLLDDQTLEMELLLDQRQMQIVWGTNVPLSRGYFPAETCFSEHMIPVLAKAGIAWTIVANNHLARSCADFPLALGSGGENCDIPNPADQINPPQGAANYQRNSISDGCGPTQVMPFGFQPHYARYVDPATGVASTIIVVPSDQIFSWQDSYSTWDLGQIAPLAARNNPAHPALVLCAHDGDNAWSGGNSYYNQWVSQMAGTSASDGYEPTTVEQFLSDFPPATNDVVHIEDGGWVFAAGDFGSPGFINWNWPPSYTGSNGNNVVDPGIGVSDKVDNWRVIIATENRVETAQQISGITPRIDQVRDPGSFSDAPNAVELGWHYCLASLDSGFVYFGCNGDECLRSIVAQSNACRNVDSIVATNPTADTTPPTVFLPQRHPWNPGGTNFGVQYGYQTVVEPNSDFWIWTCAYAASGVANVSLLLRTDGTNPPTSDQFKTYAGGPLTGAWHSTNMTRRVAANSSGYTPEYQADYYYTYVTGISNTFVDYYVSATDSYGNVRNTPIQHVWVGAGSGTVSSGNGSVVSLSTNPPAAGKPVTIQYNPAGRVLANSTNVDLHLGWNNWNPAVSPDTAMTFNAPSNTWQCTVTPPETATNMNVCFNNGNGTWDNNNSANWNFAVIGSSVIISNTIPPFTLDGAFDYPGYLLASNGTMVLYAALRGTTLYVATQSPGNSGPNDNFIFVSDALLPSATTAAPWAKAGAMAIPASAPYLAAESTDTYISWYLNKAQVSWPCAKSASTSGAMEGTLDLTAAFGVAPTNLYLCAAGYVTTNGGPLVTECPAGSGSNLNTNSFFAIPVAALQDSLGNGTFDLCDPARGFRILSAGMQAGNLVLNCAAMPGRIYQIQYAGTLSGPWSNAPSGPIHAAPPQMVLTFTNALPPGSSAKFYRVQLAPQP
ncbi:MAG TPA: carbohydrate-binding protein [Verrucomicrobiae bacterium]|nr:carbohydrate-binding protein [Verrucomicrobiae bacterium]